MICWKCRKSIQVSEVYRTTVCPFCGADLHACKGCNFYSQGNHYDCKETVDEIVVDKEKSNFCDYFSYSKNIAANGEKDSSEKDKAKAAFNALFGD